MVQTVKNPFRPLASHYPEGGRDILCVAVILFQKPGRENANTCYQHTTRSPSATPITNIYSFHITT